METINVRWDVNVESGYLNIDLDELEVNSVDEFFNLSIDKQRERMQNAIDNRPQETHMVATNWG